MRLMASRIVTIRKGDLVSIRCRLRPGMDMARLYFWSTVPGHDTFAPHVQHAVTDIVIGGKPNMTVPMSAILRDPLRREHTVEFIADETLKFCVRQEADAADEPLAKVRIKRYGPLALKLRSLWRRLTSKENRHDKKAISQG